MTGSCYRILENPSIGLQKYRATREAVTHLLAVALVQYNHMFSEFLPFAFVPELFPVAFSDLFLPSRIERCHSEDHTDAAAL